MIGKIYDLIVDAKTSRPSSDHAHALSAGGSYATVGGTSHLGQLMFLRPWLRRKYKRLFHFVWLKPSKDLPYLCDLFDEGKFTPIIDGHFDFTDHDVREAFRLYGAAQHKGKVVVTVVDSDA